MKENESNRISFPETLGVYVSRIGHIRQWDYSSKNNYIDDVLGFGSLGFLHKQPLPEEV